MLCVYCWKKDRSRCILIRLTLTIRGTLFIWMVKFEMRITGGDLLLSCQLVAKMFFLRIFSIPAGKEEGWQGTSCRSISYSAPFRLSPKRRDKNGTNIRLIKSKSRLSGCPLKSCLHPSITKVTISSVLSKRADTIPPFPGPDAFRPAWAEYRKNTRNWVL